MLPLEREALTPIVRRAVNAPDARVLDWHVDRIEYPILNPITAGLYRVHGRADLAGQTTDWAAILKIVRPPAGGMTPRGPAPPGWGEAPTHWNYWRREAFVYQSGLLEGVAGGLAAPRLLGVAQRPDPAMWVWLEEIRDEGDPAWPIERFALAARHLGQFNGAFLAGRLLPRAAWLSPGWLASWVDDVWGSLQPLVEQAGAWDHPLIRAAFPEPVAHRITRLWQDRGMLLATLDSLPRTFCHRDAHPQNLFTRAGQTIAIDWTQAGPGPAGEDVGQVVVPSILHMLVPAERLALLEATVFESYLAGLADAGAAADRDVIRLGYALSTALHWCFAGAFALRWVANDALLAAMERQFARPIAEVIQHRAAVTYRLLDLAEEARSLQRRMA